MKNVLILEDNLITAETLKNIVAGSGTDINVLVADTSEKAYALAMENNIELMLIDIVLDNEISGDVSGMKFARNIRTVENYKFTPIIIITSLEDPKLYAYSEIHCYSYIEKPYAAEKVKAVVKEALQYKNATRNNAKYIYRFQGIFYSINTDEIILVENKGKEVYIYTAYEKIPIPYISLGKLLKELDSDDFIQCNRNNIVNKKYIEYIDSVNRLIKMKGIVRQIDIGVTLKKKVLTELKND